MNCIQAANYLDNVISSYVIEDSVEITETLQTLYQQKQTDNKQKEFKNKISK